VGLNYSKVKSIFNKKVVLNQGSPFKLKIPNDETKLALDELEK